MTLNEERDAKVDDPAWRGIPTYRRYVIAGKRYVEVNGKLVRLPDVTPEQIRKLKAPKV